MSGSEAFVPQRHGSVDDVFAIAANDDESAVGIVADRLWINLAGSHVFKVEGKSLAVFDLGLRAQRLDVGLLSGKEGRRENDELRKRNVRSLRRERKRSTNLSHSVIRVTKVTKIRLYS